MWNIPFSVALSYESYLSRKTRARLVVQISRKTRRDALVLPPDGTLHDFLMFLGEESFPFHRTSFEHISDYRKASVVLVF